MIEKLAKTFFGKKKRKSQDIDESSKHVIEEGFIPYVCHYDKNTITTKNGELLQIVRVTGFGNNSSAAEINSLRDSIRESINEKATKTNIAFWFTTLRRKKNITPPGTFDEGLAKDFNKAWSDKNDLKNQYVNELYVTFIIEGVDTSVSNVATAIKSLSFGATKKMHKTALAKAHAQLDKIASNFLADIEQYGAKKLGIVDWEGILYSEPMRFFGKIINLYEERYPLAMNDISLDLSSHIVAFGERELEVVGHKNKNYAAMLSLKEYSEVSTDHLDHILQLPFEFIITQSYDFCVHNKELETYKHNDYILSISGDEEFREISGLSSMVSEDKGEKDTDYTKMQTTIALISPTKEDLAKDLDKTLSHFHDLGLMVIREDIFMEDCFWSQLPANFSFLKRQKVLETELIGGFAALHSYPSGSMDGNHWGSAIAMLKTVLDTPYYFNFHLYNSGHSLLLGPENSGKTTLTNFLLAQSQRHDARVFMVDTTGKSECFIKCLDGSYHDFSTQDANKLSLNPIKGVTNKDKLSDFIKSLIAYAKIEKAEAEKIDSICEKIIAGKISNFADAIKKFDDKTTPTIYAELKKWIDDEKLNKIFASKENFVSSNKIQAINLSEIYDNKSVLNAVICDLLNKIENLFDDKPFIVVLDDIWECLDNETTAIKFEKFLELAAKKNCVVVAKCSDASSILECKSHAAILGNITNKIYMPDAQFPKEGAKALEMNEEEFKIVHMLGQSGQNNFLLKCGDNSIIFDFDLNPLTQYIDIFSNSELTLSVLAKVLDANKTDNKDSEKVKVSTLLPKFLEELKNVEDQRLAEAIKQDKAERDRQRIALKEKMGGDTDD